eukprot:16427575-Heterocapsa_arctica.AAC.1
MLPRGRAVPQAGPASRVRRRVRARGHATAAAAAATTIWITFFSIEIVVFRILRVQRGPSLSPSDSQQTFDPE